MEIFPAFPPTALQSVTSPVKICSTCFLVRFFSGLFSFTITASPSYATMTGVSFVPLAWAADSSVGFAWRLDMPMSAVPSMIAVNPVVEPSAAISKLVSGFFAL